MGLTGRVVCQCFGVTEPEIERVVRDNQLQTVEQVTHYTKAGGGCGKCKAQIEKILGRIGEERARAALPAPAPQAPRLTTIQKIRRIEETIDREIRPSLRNDGGDIELIDVDGSRVVVALRGMCAHCKVSPVTLKDLVQAKLREFVSEDLVVEGVDA